MRFFDLNEIGHPFSRESKAMVHRTPMTENISVGDLLFDSRFANGPFWVVTKIEQEETLIRVVNERLP